MTLLSRDLRLATRTLLRSPLASAVAAATLTVAAGSNIALFTVVNGVLLRPLPFDAPGDLVLGWNTNRSQGRTYGELSYPQLDDWRSNARSFSRVAAITETTSGFTFAGGPRSTVIQGQPVSSDFFDVLGSPAATASLDLAPHIASFRGSRSILGTHLTWARLIDFRHGFTPEANHPRRHGCVLCLGRTAGRPVTERTTGRGWWIS